MLIKNLPLLLAVAVIPLNAHSQAPAAADTSAVPAHQFFEVLSSLCGSHYVGEMTFPTDSQDSFKGKQLVAEFSDCAAQEIRVPFKVGEDTSRTWVFTKTAAGARLKHDHRHKDGSPDDVTNYGGDSTDDGSALRQAFAADDFTQQLIPAASTNVWNIILSEDKQQLTYHLERHGKPRFTAVLNKAEEVSE
ncbi:MAG: hypothetical protein HKN50_05030 [Gammaproteobacteria bacterium]|nr:hypothetical protein [Gammaproteobacteria bacterium]